MEDKGWFPRYVSSLAWHRVKCAARARPMANQSLGITANAANNLFKE